MSDRYVIAVKRGARKRIDPRWPDQLSGIDGLEVLASGRLRSQVSATPKAIRQLGDRLGADFHIEPEISHKPLERE